VVARARSGLGTQNSVAVPYRCKISGAEETLILISDEVANLMMESSPVLGDSIDAILVTALLRTELCTCDLATIAAYPEDRIHARLEDLVNAGVLVHREIDGMNYFRCANSSTSERILTNATDERDASL
jgi:hypothetical protein